MKVIEKYESKFIELLKEMEAEIGADGIRVCVDSSTITNRDNPRHSYGIMPRAEKTYQFTFEVMSLPRVEVL